MKDNIEKQNEKEKERIQNQNQSLLARGKNVHCIETTVRANMTSLFKREFTFEKIKLAMGKREKAVEKGLANLKVKEEKMSKEQVVPKKSQKQVKLDCDSMFHREMKLWHDKKDLGKDQRHFEEKMRQERIDLCKEQDKFIKRIKKDGEK